MKKTNNPIKSLTLLAEKIQWNAPLDFHALKNRYEERWKKSQPTT